MPDTTKQRNRSNAALWLAAAWLVLVPAIVYCYQHVDRPLALWLHSHQSRQWPALNWPHQLVDVFVYSLLLVFIGCGIALWRQRNTRWLPTIFDAALSLAVVLALKAPVKALFGRTWPDTFYHNNPSWLDHGVYGFLPLHWQVAYWAFPSGHTAQIVAISTAAILHKPKLAWIFLPFSLFVMADLVALNFHWLSDVLAGVLFGASVAFVVNRLDMTGQLQQWRAGRLRQQPRHSSSR
jgi:membrane-associated phospholipid phosphatase